MVNSIQFTDSNSNNIFILAKKIIEDENIIRHTMRPAHNFT